MKAVHSEKYYRDNYENFIKKTNDNDYMNLESELESELNIFDTDVIEKIRPIYAKKIYVKASKILKERMMMIQHLQSGKSSFGYTTQNQEIHEMHRIVQRFEFNCIQLADFKKKYL